MGTGVNLEIGRIVPLCLKWKIERLEVFGSARRSDFRPASDVDLLATFSREADWSLLDHAQMEDEFAVAVGRRVDLVSRSTVEQSPNWIRRREILSSAQLVYDSRRLGSA